MPGKIINNNSLSDALFAGALKKALKGKFSFEENINSFTHLSRETMKKYKSHKEVHAKPMNRGDYNHYKGWDIPKDENPLDDGYLVVYNKDTPDHYESWSPKKQFDEGYTEIENK